MKQIPWKKTKERFKQGYESTKKWVKEKRTLAKEKGQIRREQREARMEARRNTEFGKTMTEVCKWMNRFSLLLHVVWACIIYFIMEAVSRHSVVQAWEYLVETPLVFLFNTYAIFATFLLVYLVRRRFFMRVMISAIWLILGIVNGCMLAVRVTPFNAQDLVMLTDALTMVDQYMSRFQFVLILIGIAILIGLIVFLGIKGTKYKGKMHHVIAAIAAFAGLYAVAPLTDYAVEQRLVSSYFGNIAFAYEDYGFTYCFLASLFDTGIDEPNTYSQKAIEKLKKDGNLMEVSTDREEMPNIIMIQLESFFDPREVEFFTTSKDPIPTFRYLMENYSSGYCKVPSVGAGTANTEFEVLTGMNLRYFGPGEYPYKTVVKSKEVESVATALREFGYGTHALHNNGGAFYSRADVFDNMGFDTFASKEFMNILEYTENGWATDDVLVQHIVNALDSTEQQDFVFGITVEGHGAYPTEPVIENPEILVQGIDDEGKKNAWEYYINHLYETDKVIAKLLDVLENREEPTVLVMYGDHLPTMNLRAEDLKNRYLYNTNYVIWSNIGLEKQDRNIPTYQLTAEVFSRLDIRSGTIFNFHQNRRQTRHYLEDLEMLQYDQLYGEYYIYGGEKYEMNREQDFQMGVLGVEVTGVAQNADGSYSLYGENFTEYSVVYIDNVKQETTFLNNTRMELKDTTLKEGDVLKISQIGETGRLFRTTEEYIYQDNQFVLLSEQSAS